MCFLVLDKISFAVSAVWFKLKINPLTFTVSNHLQMDHQLHFSFFPLPLSYVLQGSGQSPLFYFFTKRKKLFVLAAGALSRSEANLIKNSTWLNSAKSGKKGRGVILLCTIHKGSALSFYKVGATIIPEEFTSSTSPRRFFSKCYTDGMKVFVF